MVIETKKEVVPLNTIYQFLICPICGSKSKNICMGGDTIRGCSTDYGCGLRIQVESSSGRVYAFYSIRGQAYQQLVADADEAATPEIVRKRIIEAAREVMQDWCCEIHQASKPTKPRAPKKAGDLNLPEAPLFRPNAAIIINVRTGARRTREARPNRTATN